MAEEEQSREGARKTRERLLEATEAVFREQGYDRTALADIARQAGLTTGAIYSNFRDKAELLLEVISRVEQSQDAAMARVRSEGGVTPSMLDLFLDEARTWVDPDLAPERELIVESRVACRRDPAVRDQLMAKERPRLAIVTELLESLQTTEAVDPDLDAEAAAVFLFALPAGLALLEAAGMRLPSTEAWEELLDRLARNFLLGPAGRELLDVPLSEAADAPEGELEIGASGGGSGRAGLDLST